MASVGSLHGGCMCLRVAAGHTLMGHGRGMT